MLFERGINISHETIWLWWNRFGPLMADKITKRHTSIPQQYSPWRWHIDEAFVKISGKVHYLWRAVDHKGEVLDAVVTKKRDKKAALKVLKSLMTRYGRPKCIVTDKLKSYKAAMRELGCQNMQETGGRHNFRKKEAA